MMYTSFDHQKKAVVEDLTREMRRREISVGSTAKALDIDAAYLYRCISGQRSPSIDVISRWAALYGITLKSDLRLCRIPL